MAKFVERDASQLYLLPVDIREWVPEDDLAHFVLEAVERVPMSSFMVNEPGTGSAQYHPRMMLALLIYCYANGIFGSRRIERATYRDLGVRYVAADCHPDHDTICAFRRQNIEAVSEAFLQVLLMARVHDFRPPVPDQPVKTPKADWLKRMQAKMATDESPAHYRLRKQTVEPVFGIVKEAMGFA